MIQKFKLIRKGEPENIKKKSFEVSNKISFYLQIRLNIRASFFPVLYY